MERSAGTVAQRSAALTDSKYRVVIFDLDRTLVPGSSLAHLARMLVDEGVIRRRHLARHAVSAAVFRRAGTSEAKAERVARSVLATVDGLEQAPMVEFARRTATALTAVAFPAGRWLLQAHLDAGHFCVLLSAAPQELVEVIGGEFGVHRAIGTQAELRGGRYTGRLEGPFCHGAGKIERLRAELGPVEFGRAVGYSDSASDIPLLELCSQPVAVNPDRRLLVHARRARWPVMRF